MPVEVLQIADAAATIRNLSRRIGDERPASGNIIWQPVKQMKMCWEINYGEAESFDKTIQTEALQAVWGTWFYF